MKSLKHCIIICLIIFTASLSAQKVFCAFEDGILAIVNNEAITLKDLREYLGLVYIGLKSSGRNQEDIREGMAYYEANGLEKLINDKLMVYAAEKKGLTIRPEVAEKRINEIRSQFPNKKDFLAEIVSQGLTLAELRDKITDQLKTYYIEEIEIRSKVFVSPQNVTEYYEQNSEKFRKPKRVDLESIFIPYDNDQENAERKAREAIYLLKKDSDIENFKIVAKKFSQSSSIGIINKGETLPAIENVVFKLQEGEISPRVEVDTGIYIFRLNKKLPEEIAPLSEVKNSIHNILFRKQLNDRKEKWLNDLRDDAYIEIRQ